MKRRLTGCALLTIAMASGLSGHELGTTQAVATFRHDGTYRIDISVDPDALLTRLELASGAPLTAVVAAAERDRRIAELTHVFLDGLDIRFDGVRDRPRIEYRPASEPSDAQAPGVVRASGRVPEGVRGLSVSYRFAMGWYALEVRVEDQVVKTVWLEAGKPGEMVALAPQPAGRFRDLRQIVPLLVLGLVLMTVRARGSKR